MAFLCTVGTDTLAVTTEATTIYTTLPVVWMDRRSASLKLRYSQQRIPVQVASACRFRQNGVLHHAFLSVEMVDLE